MYISKQSKEIAKRLVKICLRSGNFDESSALEVVKYIAANKNTRNLQTLTYFKQLVKLELNKETAKLEFAIDLGDSVITEITTRLEKIYKRKMRLEKQKKSELLGGFKVTVGSDVYDYSTTSRLEQLKMVLSS